MTLLALPDGALALGLGTMLALGAAAVVLGPLMRDDDAGAPAAPRPMPDDGGVSERASAVDALREIEFDRATGKLSDADYHDLKATYTREALAELRANDAPDVPRMTPVADDDDVERAIRRFRGGAGSLVCPVDGPRPETDAAFCSACGRFLEARCPHCGADCPDAETRFCGRCGGGLAALAAAGAASG